MLGCLPNTPCPGIEPETWVCAWIGNGTCHPLVHGRTSHTGQGVIAVVFSMCIATPSCLSGSSEKMVFSEKSENSFGKCSCLMAHPHWITLWRKKYQLYILFRILRIFHVSRGTLWFNCFVKPFISDVRLCKSVCRSLLAEKFFKLWEDQ